MLPTRGIISIAASAVLVFGAITRTPPVFVVALCVLAAHLASKGNIFAIIVISIAAFALSHGLMTKVLPKVVPSTALWGEARKTAVVAISALVLSLVASLVLKSVMGNATWRSSGSVVQVAVIAVTALATLIHLGRIPAAVVAATMIAAILFLRQREFLHYGIAITVFAFLVAHGVAWRSSFMSMASSSRKIYTTIAITAALSAAGIFAVMRVRPFFVALIVVALWVLASNLKSSTSTLLLLPNGRRVGHTGNIRNM